MADDKKTSEKSEKNSNNQKKDEAAKFEGMHREKSANSINLIPGLTAHERGKINRRENINLTSAGGVFFITLFTVIVLLLNFYAHTQQRVANNKLNTVNASLDEVTSKELQMKTVINKYDAIVQLKIADLQYYYFVNEIQEVPTGVKIKNMALDEFGNYELSGYTETSSDFEKLMVFFDGLDSFVDVNINSYKDLSADEISDLVDVEGGQYSVSWSVSGKYESNATEADLAATNDSTETTTE